MVEVGVVAAVVILAVTVVVVVVVVPHRCSCCGCSCFVVAVIPMAGEVVFASCHRRSLHVSPPVDLDLDL